VVEVHDPIVIETDNVGLTRRTVVQQHLGQTTDDYWRRTISA
jgi:hypothetical protein